MCPLILTDDTGRYFSKVFSNPGKEPSWLFSIALVIVTTRGKNNDWWWYWSSSAWIVVSWKFCANSNSDASLAIPGFTTSLILWFDNIFPFSNVRWIPWLGVSLYVRSSILFASDTIHMPVRTSLLHCMIISPRYRISHKISLLSTSHPTLNSFTTDSEFFGWCRLLQVRRYQRRLMAQAPFEVTYWQWFAWVFGWSFCVSIAHPDQILNWHNSICLLPPVPSRISQIMLAFISVRASAWRCWRSECL